MQFSKFSALPEVLMHRCAWLTALVLMFLFAWRIFAAEPQPPNVVFIIADDLGWADVGFHGGKAPTPHLDRLAKEGVELTQHYVAPVCSPTRAGFLTGRCWSRFGVTSPQNQLALPWDTVTLPRALHQVGYETCLTGKWHLGSKPEQGPNHFGFEHSYGSLAGGVGPFDHHYKQGPFSKTWHRNEKLLEEKGHVTDLIASEAVEWIGQRGKKPFFLYAPFTAVHLPIKEPRQWLDKVPPEITGEIQQQYAACIMHLDDAVGQIVAALEKAGKREQTLLVFTSDNGGSTAENAGQTYPADDYPTGKLPGDNRPFRNEKGSVYEGGTRVPCIVHWPGKLKPGKHSAPVQVIDWMSTFTALAGYQPSEDLRWDGVNLWPQIAAGAEPAVRSIYTVGPGFRSRALRHGEWKLILHEGKENQVAELYQISKDPSETTNLAAKEPAKLAELTALLATAANADRDRVAKE
jgi:arylsulfatase A-like enzyme